jgi:hypothetical protein
VRIIILLFIFISNFFSIVLAATGKNLYISRCAMCHGMNARATGYLAKKSIPPTPDLTTCQFQKRLSQYPGVIVSSIILMPNGALIPDTLKRNGVLIKHHTWTDEELRSINIYVISLIHKQPRCFNE